MRALGLLFIGVLMMTAGCAGSPSPSHDDAKITERYPVRTYEDNMTTTVMVVAPAGPVTLGQGTVQVLSRGEEPVTIHLDWVPTTPATSLTFTWSVKVDAGKYQALASMASNHPTNWTVPAKEGQYSVLSFTPADGAAAKQVVHVVFEGRVEKS